MTRRTQADRTAATRAALVGAGRELFGTTGYAGVGTEAITRLAGVSRGALYHHFTDKAELFAVVLDDVESTISARLAEAVLGAGESAFVPSMMTALGTWFDACAEPAVQRIVLVDGPSVLGWARWREVTQAHSLGLIELVLEQAMASGELVRRPVRPLAHLVIAMADEAALYVVGADDADAARAEMLDLVRPLLSSLLA